MERFYIADCLIGKDQGPFIIAEAGINHNGELEKAYSMIKAAKNAGVDAVKFQTFKAEEFIGDPKQTYTYTSQGKEVTESMLEMFKCCEFSHDEWVSIKKKCDEEDILFLSTPQNRSDLDLLLKIGIPAIKVGSDDFINTPLLKSYAQTRLPMILSSGMSDLKEVQQALKAVGSLKGYPTVLMICTSEYPTPPENANLLRLKTLSATFPSIVLGFSDHTQGTIASSLAIALGAVVFEKHFTLNHNLPGPDHWFSEDTEGLSSWVKAIKTSYAMMGSGVCKPTMQEQINKRYLRRVVVAASDIKKGQVLSMDHLAMKRMAGKGGLAPAIACSLIGKRADRCYKRGKIIKL